MRFNSLRLSCMPDYKKLSLQIGSSSFDEDFGNNLQWI
jgi:hypothetical protein